MAGISTPFTPGFLPPGAPGSPEARGPQQQPPQPETPGMDALAGPMPQQTAPDPQARLRAIMMRYREIENQINAIAQEFPEGAKDLRQAVNAIRSAMSKSVASPNLAQEPQAPRTLA